MLEPVEADLLLAALHFRLEPSLEGTGVALLWAVQELPNFHDDTTMTTQSRHI